MSREDALDRTNLRDLLTELTGAPRQLGAAARWRCVTPTHEDENPSTTVFKDSHGRERYRCWSCGDAGTAIDALMQARSMSVAEAISELESRTNSTDTPAPERSRAERQPATAVALSNDAKTYINDCADRLWTPEGRSARTWLLQRGLADPDLLRTNLVGFDPGRRKLPRAEGLPGNITFERDGRTRRLDLPGGSGVTFPAFNRNGEPVHVQCRLLQPGQNRFKYVNPRRAHGTIPAASFPIEPAGCDRDVLIVTEGTPDGLIGLTAGFRVAVVTSATTVRQATADDISAHASGATIVLAFDNDDAGTAATAALQARLSGPVRVLRLPAGQDLTDTYNRRSTPECHLDTTSRPISTR
jgi:DNA primase